jgi:hypothetical protein
VYRLGEPATAKLHQGRGILGRGAAAVVMVMTVLAVVVMAAAMAGGRYAIKHVYT